MVSSGATGTVTDTRRASSNLTSAVSAPNSTSRIPGQPPIPARIDPNSCTAGGQVTRSPDRSTRTRPESANALVTASLTSPADASDNSPATASTHTSGPRRTCRTVRTGRSGHTLAPPSPEWRP